MYTSVPFMVESNLKRDERMLDYISCPSNIGVKQVLEKATCTGSRPAQSE